MKYRRVGTGLIALLATACLSVPLWAGSGYSISQVNREDNEYVIGLGKRDGAQVGMVLNVYRDKEITADIGHFKIITSVFLGRIIAHQVSAKQTIGRLRSGGGKQKLVQVGDYTQPALVIAADELFEVGDTDLREAGLKRMGQAMRFIKRFDATKIRVEVHTDNQMENSTQMSQRQADQVRDFLASEGGFEKGHFVAIGYGAEKPLVSNAKAAGRRMNRRVEIVIER
ncbi:MAG: OmpA family protein [bacterium]|nr:OmpA family protein [bacterium]